MVLFFGTIAAYVLGITYIIAAIISMRESNRIAKSGYDYGGSHEMTDVGAVFLAAGMAMVPFGWMVSAVSMLIFTGVAAWAAVNEVRKTKMNFVRLWISTVLPLSGMVVADYLIDLNRQYLVAVIATLAAAFIAAIFVQISPIQRKNETRVVKRANFSRSQSSDVMNGC